MSSYKKFICAADNHGALVCEKAAAKFFSFVDEWKPHYRIHLGDLWDFAALRKAASIEDKMHGISEDFAAGLAFLDRFKPQYLTLGNHDDRVWQRARNCVDGMLKERCAEVASEAEDEFRKRRIQFVEYDVGAFLRLPEGGPRFIHGFRSTMYPAKAHFENWGDCIHGHVHKPDEYSARHIGGGASHSAGALADLSKLTYAKATPAKLGWRNGWIYGLINTKTGDWKAWHVTNEQGVWISPLGVL